MNREIKFRGKRRYGGEWVYGYLCDHGETDCCIWEAGLWLTVLPETVGQYTGLKDKNGVEIYEGDILAHTGDTSLSKWLVIFKNGCFGVQNIHIDGTTHYNEFWPINSEYFFIDREIVANTHQPIAHE